MSKQNSKPAIILRNPDGSVLAELFLKCDVVVTEPCVAVPWPSFEIVETRFRPVGEIFDEVRQREADRRAEERLLRVDRRKN